MTKVRSVLNVKDGLRPSGKTPKKFMQAARAALLREYPTATNVTVTETHHEADRLSSEPYACLVAEGEVD